MFASDTCHKSKRHFRRSERRAGIAVLILVLANGFFVAVEFALVSVRRSKIETLAAANMGGAKSVLRALDRLDAMLSASQFGITIASLALGAVGESTLARLFEPILLDFLPPGASTLIAHSIAIAIPLAVITYLHLVLGEYAPKALAIEKAEAISLATARWMELFYQTFKPFIWLINVSGIKFLRLFGVDFRPGHHTVYTEEELRRLIDISHQSGQLQEEEREMIHNVFEFADLTAREVAWLIDEEWAATAEDVLWRRSKLGLWFTHGEVAALDAWMTEQRRRVAAPAA